jgi:hypothetical protein
MSRGARRTVFLDRDGVLNRAIVRDGTSHPSASLEELQSLSDARAALAALIAAGWLLIGITQSARCRARHAAARDGRGHQCGRTRSLALARHLGLLS